MLVRHYIVLIVRIERLMLGRDVDFFGGELDGGEGFQKVGVVGGVEMEVG